MPWNYDLIQSMYPSVANGYLFRVGDRLNLNPSIVANKIRALVKEEGADPNSSATLTKAREETAGQPPTSFPYKSPTFGYLAQWTSEVGGGSDLDALLRHADAYLNPTWLDGGLYYGRCNDGWDADGNYIHNEPYTGNACIAYARLNVKNGQKKMWDHPWTKEEVRSRPYIDGLFLEKDIDCLRGAWDEQEQAMLVSLKTWNGSSKKVQFAVENLPAGNYGVYLNGELRDAVEVTPKSGSLPLDLEVDGNGTDLVVLHV